LKKVESLTRTVTSAAPRLLLSVPPLSSLPAVSPTFTWSPSQ
jgi:hypothetical protein